MDLVEYMSEVQYKIKCLPENIKNDILYQLCDIAVNTDASDSDILDKILLLLDLKGITADLK